MTHLASIIIQTFLEREYILRQTYKNSSLLFKLFQNILILFQTKKSLA